MDLIYKVNGREFYNKTDAEKYEKEVKEAKEKAKKLREEKDKRGEEIRLTYEIYLDLVEKYEKDYGNSYVFGSDLMYLKSLFNI